MDVTQELYSVMGAVCTFNTAHPHVYYIYPIENVDWL